MRERGKTFLWFVFASVVVGGFALLAVIDSDHPVRCGLQIFVIAAWSFNAGTLAEELVNGR